MLRRLLVVCALAFAIPSLFAQVAAPPPDHPAKPKKLPGTCAVSGRVVTAADGAPLRSARVGLIQAGVNRHPVVYATITDNDGRFEIKQVESGRYEFFATHIGYIEQHYQAKGTDPGDGAVLSLTSGEKVADAMFRLVRAAVITGKVMDDTGEPMVGVNVSVLHKPSDEEREEEGPRGKKLELTSVSSVATDDRGEYRIFGLKPGEYFVKAAEAAESFFNGQMQEGGNETVLRELGSQYAPVYFPGVLQMDQAQAVVLSAGEEARADIAMRHMKLVEVSGRILGPDGGAAMQSYVSLSQVGVDDWGGELSSGTDGSGEFSIKGVPPGSYFIRAGMQDKGKFYNTRQKIEVGEAKVEGVLLSLGSGATIRGRVRTASGAPVMVGRMMIRLQPSGEEDSSGTFSMVSKDGTFELSGVADGAYALVAFGLEEGWFVRSAHLGSEDVLQDGAQVEGGAAKGSLDIVVSSDGGQIEGAVTDSDKGQPLAGAQLRANPEPESEYNHSRIVRTTSDQNGHFVLKDLPPGKYKVSAKLASPVPGIPSVKSEPVAVSVAEREHRTVDIKLAVPKSE